MEPPDPSVEPADAATMDQWDSLVAGADGGFVFQTSMWGKFWQRYVGGQPTYWVAKDGDGAIVGLLMVLRKTPAWDVFFERPLGQVILPVMRSVFPILEVLNGPVIIAPDSAAAVNRAFAVHLRGWSTRNGLLRKVIVTSPPSVPDEGIWSEFESYGFHVTRLQTILIDLQKSEEELWRQLHRSARKTVSRAQREGVVVRQMNDMGELRHLYRSVASGRERLGLRTFGFRNWELMWEWLAPADAIQMFVAEAGGHVVACLGVWAFGRMIQEFASVRIEDNSPGGDLLKWEVIQWGRRHGYASYDLAGVNISPEASEKEQKIARYKLKWGGVPASSTRHSSVSGPYWRPEMARG